MVRGTGPGVEPRMGQTDLVVLGDEPVQALLNDVVAVEVLDERDDTRLEGHDDRVDLQNDRDVSPS